MEVTLRDNAGVLSSETSAAVTITVTGGGELLALASAQPDSEERFDASTRTTFDGRLLAVVRPTAVGEITVTADADGFSSVETKIQAVRPD